MDLTRLAAKQKRLQSWLAFVEEGGVQGAALKRSTLDALSRYKTLLARCWESKEINTENAERLSDLERELESLNESARMTVVPRK